MPLHSFIEANMERILAEWESFARTLLPAAKALDAAALRDHAELMLQTALVDMKTPQSLEDQTRKSRGEQPRNPNSAKTAAETHGRLRAIDGFTLRQLIAEYRALRATVLRLWAEDFVPYPESLTDMTRFNEAIDQAISESVDHYATETEHWRQVFLGMLGHDLRAPLHSMLLTSQLLVRKPDAPVAKLATRLVRASERMSLLLDDILVYSRFSLNLGISVNCVPADLAQAMEEEVELQRAAWPQRAIAFTAQGNTLGTWDAPRLKQVVGNLISNAAKYGEPGGLIIVRLLGDQDHEVVFSVENTGPTIPASEIPTLFEPLRRAARANEESERYSLGLGLFVVRQIVHAHTGSVSVASQGRSTVFTVTLPRTAAPSSAHGWV